MFECGARHRVDNNNAATYDVHLVRFVIIINVHSIAIRKYTINVFVLRLTKRNYVKEVFILKLFSLTYNSY